MGPQMPSIKQRREIGVMLLRSHSSVLVPHAHNTLISKRQVFKRQPFRSSKRGEIILNHAAELQQVDLPVHAGLKQIAALLECGI